MKLKQKIMITNLFSLYAYLIANWTLFDLVERSGNKETFATLKVHCKKIFLMKNTHFRSY